jgi:adenylate cyclase
LATKAVDGFSDNQIAALERLVPYLALAIKSVALTRMTGALMETYLGRRKPTCRLGTLFLPV